MYFCSLRQLLMPAKIFLFIPKKNVLNSFYLSYIFDSKQMYLMSWLIVSVDL